MTALFRDFRTHDYILLLIGFGFVLFFSSYQLFVSPETWLDEGLIIQSAIGLGETGKSAVPVAPGVYEPAWYITTGFPVTLPLAGAFSIFGISLESARLVMLGFLLFFYCALFIYMRATIGRVLGWVGFFLLIFFGPVYGHGRNVLGEVPGLLYILISLIPLLQSGPLTRTRALIVGAGAGLAFAAKPIFILFLPALLAACLLRRQELQLQKVFLFSLLGFGIPALFWIYTQFDTVALSRVLAVYANPREISLIEAAATNLYRFFTELQPLYFVLALLAWTTSYIVRRYKRTGVPIAEEALLFFSVLVFLAFLRTDGYYRYFFPAQVFAVLYLPASLWHLSPRRFSGGLIVLFAFLLLFHMNETSFRSWTATHYDSQRTEALKRYFAALPPSEEVFVYQAPEVITFVGRHPAYQYVRITPSLSAGDAYTARVGTGMAPRVITPAEFFQKHADTTFRLYTVAQTLDNYVILIPKNARASYAP